MGESEEDYEARLKNWETIAARPSHGMGVYNPKATHCFSLRQEAIQQSEQHPWWHPDRLSPRILRRYDLEGSLQDNLDDTLQAQAESGIQGLARLFSSTAWAVWRAKMQLLRHGFRIPTRAKPLRRPPLTFETVLRLLDEIDRRRTHRRNHGHGKYNGSSFDHTQSDGKAQP